ncbi:MAG: hypothetical protein CBC12_11880 [Candidatus Puniceispirillum sp. TMED52]|nr:MAG: hypothetical protein CBC12_11880 [Candidatus Puniceispirillum sp. TMED52]
MTGTITSAILIKYKSKKESKLEKHLSTFYKEDSSGPRAEIFANENDVIGIKYYMGIGTTEPFKTEMFPGKHESYVESAAENWTLGIKILNE